MGCRVCRARKVKCDGRPNGCRNCERLQLECVGDNGAAAAAPSTSPSSALSPDRASFSSSSLRKIRTYRSCTSCRLSKTKCNGDRPRCSRCSAKRIDCVYDGGSAPRWTRNLNHAVKREDEDGDEGNKGSSESAEAEGLEEGFRPATGSGMAPTPTTAGFTFESNDTLAWLLSPDLPPPRHIRRLVEHYFANIHPIRCFAFVHKPSFMRQLDSGFNSDDDSALLHIICAHGAKFHALSLGQFDQAPSATFLRAAGNQWAKKAESLLMSNYGKLSVHRLMTAVLLYDFRLRLGEYSQALMLSGFAVRMAQALKINNEYSADILCTEGGNGAPSVASRESRRRLMWACYVIDSVTGRGAEQLTMLREKDIDIQLPCNERNFGLRIPSVTETLGVGHVLQFLSPAIVPPKPAGNMGIMAYYIRIVTLGKRIIKYINAPDASPPPWLPESDFSALDAAMTHWRRDLPDFVEYSPDTIYARLDSNQLGGLMLIHSTYHHNYLTLYKISMPELFCLNSAPVFPYEHRESLQALQAEAYFHARQIARLLAEAAEHGIRLLSDSVLPFFAYDSSRVMLYYVARVMDSGRIDAKERLKEAVEAVEENRKLLRMMAPLFPVSETFAVTVERWLYKMRRGSREPLPRSARPPEDFSAVQDVEMSSYAASSVKAASEFALPPISTARQTPMYAASDTYRPDFSRSTSWTPANGPSRANSSVNNSPPWDAAQQLVGLSKGDKGEGKGMCEGLDLDDLRNWLRWDVFSMMEMAEGGLWGGSGSGESRTEERTAESDWASTSLA